MSNDNSRIVFGKPDGHIEISEAARKYHKRLVEAEITDVDRWFARNRKNGKIKGSRRNLTGSVYVCEDDVRKLIDTFTLDE